MYSNNSTTYVAVIIIDGQRDSINVYAESIEAARQWIADRYPTAAIRSIH